MNLQSSTPLQTENEASLSLADSGTDHGLQQAWIVDFNRDYSEIRYPGHQRAL